MAFKSIGLSDELHQYVLAHSPIDPVTRDLIDETRALFGGVANLQIAPEQAPFFTVLTKALNVTHAIEVGTFTGLSALSIARGLAPGGDLICFDISEEYTSVARKYWKRAGVADRIELRIGRAVDTLKALPSEPHFDLAFIDADKTNYPVYWAEIVPRMRAGGLILLDNVLRGGRVVTDGPHSDDDLAMLGFNEVVVTDSRVQTTMAPIADGITFAVKL
jgi:caffeoyl-CoA O-methyltransferase